MFVHSDCADFSYSNIDHLHDARLIWLVFIGSVDESNLLSGLDQFESLGSVNGLLNRSLQIASSNLVAVHASAGVGLAYGLGIRGTGENLYLWSVFGNESSELAGLGKDENQGDVLLIHGSSANS